MLPALDCGACGEADCTAMTQRIVAGEKTPGDCVAAREHEVTVNGQSVGLNPLRRRCFPAASRMLARQGHGPRR
ncbi:MAG: (Fe-S)-binding protein [Bilophila wadsworthia]